MSFYRDTYLKSDHWQNLRLDRLVEQRGRCAICNAELGTSLDVHHIQYRKLYNVRVTDLRGLCRSCHTEVHRVIESLPELKSIPQSSKRWWRTCFMLKKRLRLEKKVGSDVLKAALILKNCLCHYNKLRARFYRYKRLVRAELDPGLRSFEIPWSPKVYDWMLQIPKTLSAVQFYRRWLKFSGGAFYWPQGEH